MSNQATDTTEKESECVAQHELSPKCPELNENSAEQVTESDHAQQSSGDAPSPPHKDPLECPSSSEDELEEWEAQRNHHKELGDQAYKSQNYVHAITHYTSALSVDPSHVILYSNRSAAYLSNREKSKALQDGKKCIELDPAFIKGHSRVAAALYSLGRYGEAKIVFYRIQRLEKAQGKSGGSDAAKKGIEDCERMEEKVKQWREQELERQLALAKEAELLEQQAIEEKRKQEQEEEEEKERMAKAKKSGYDDEDLLADFFDDVEEATTIPQEKPEREQEEEPATNQIKIQVSDLGTTEKQVERLACSNHEWYNLNPFRVLDISHLASTDMIGRRYKALSLLLHPDKVRNKHAHLSDKAEVAFEYVRKAMIALKDEDKAKHVVSLVDQGMKNGKREYEILKANTSDSSSLPPLEEYQDKATMKIFAEIERKRRDVDRRKRAFEMRERDQEDAELDRSKKERRFEKSWKEENRVENRIGNWREFQKRGK